MIHLWATVLVLVNLVWLALNLIGLPGNWLMVLSTAIVAWLYWEMPDTPDRHMIGLGTLGAAVGLAFLGEIVEFIAGVFGSKRAGGSRGGAVGALIGGIAGAIVGTFVIPIPVFGSLAGACGGAFAGALIMELAGGRPMEASVRSGFGAGVGRFFGTVGKLAVGVVIWVVVAVAAFWP